MISFSKNGSMAGNPTKGLLGNSQINAFVPGTQPKTLGTQNLNAANPNGIPTAAARSDLQGADYFNNLIANGTAAEKHAGLLGLSNLKNVKKSVSTDSQGNTHTVEFQNTEKTGDTTTPSTTSQTADSTKTGTSTTPTITSQTTGTPTTPQVGSAKENAQNVLNAGQMTDAEKQAILDVANAQALTKGYSNVNALGGYAGQPGFNPTGDNAPLSPEQIREQLARPDLVGRQPAISALLGNLGNIYGSAATTGAAAELSGAQTAAGRGLTAAQNVFGASLPGALSGGAYLYNPITGEPLDKSGNALLGGVNKQSAADLQGEYNKGKVVLGQAKGIQSQIANTLSANPTLNSQPLSALTNLNELLSGQTSAPGQQLLAQQIRSYIDTLGLDANEVSAQIAHQQSGTLAQLLDSLYKTAELKNEAVGTQAKSLAGGTPSTSGGSTGGGLYDF